MVTEIMKKFRGKRGLKQTSFYMKQLYEIIRYHILKEDFDGNKENLMAFPLKELRAKKEFE